MIQIDDWTEKEFVNKCAERKAGAKWNHMWLVHHGFHLFMFAWRHLVSVFKTPKHERFFSSIQYVTKLLVQQILRLFSGLTWMKPFPFPFENITCKNWLSHFLCFYMTEILFYRLFVHSRPIGKQSDCARGLPSALDEQASACNKLTSGFHAWMDGLGCSEQNNFFFFYSVFILSSSYQ